MRTTRDCLVFWFVVGLLGLSALPTLAGWEEDLDALVRVPDGPEQERLLERVLAADPDWRAVARAIESMTFPDPPIVGEAALRTAMCSDAVERPWIAFVPDDYDPAVPTPLLVALHGGVGRADLIEDPMEYVAENEYLALAEAAGWIAIFPFGQDGATWWDDVGMKNIRALLRTVKREYNVDDDRVWMIGFSDGASAGFLHAMVAPDDYAAFVCLNGHMGVGSLDGELPTYATNMAARPIYAVTTHDDGLYPSARMRPTIEMARRAGADILYRELPGTHDFDYAETEIPRVRRFLERHARDPLPTRVAWETAERRFGRRDWIGVDRVTVGPGAPWHRDHNCGMVDERVTIGFHPDWEFEGEGVFVENVVEDDNPASEMGLLAGDVIVEGNGAAIADLDGLNEFKETIGRGDSFEMTVLRDGERVLLAGEIPEPANYLIFQRTVPSGMVHAWFAANRFGIKTSRVGALRIFVHPDMVALDQNVVVEVDGEVVHDAPVEPDVAYLLGGFLEDRDRTRLYVGEIGVEVPERKRPPKR